MRPSRYRPVGVMGIVLGLAITGCGDTPGSTPADSALSITTAADTTAPSTTTSTSKATTTTRVNLGEPITTTGWALEAGDLLVSDQQGVRQVRDGGVVSTPVTSPTYAAVADGLGGIVVQPRMFPRGGLELWRVTPDGAATLLHRSDVALYYSDSLELFDVAIVEPLSPGPSVLFVEERCLQDVGPYCHPEDVLLALPLAGCGEPVVIAAPVGSWEGGIGGVGWQADPGRFLVSMAAEGSFWMSALGVSGMELAWDENPNPHVDSGPPIAVVFSMAVIPDSDQIVFAESCLEDWWGGDGMDLVRYDASAGTEEWRVAVGPAPILHAGNGVIAVSTTTSPFRDAYLPVAVIDLNSGESTTLAVTGRATVVRHPWCCTPPLCTEPHG